MNSLLDYTERARLIRAALDLPCDDNASPLVRGYVFAAQLRMLERIEISMAATLARGGMGPEAAAQSALEFVRQVVAHYRAEHA